MSNICVNFFNEIFFVIVFVFNWYVLKVVWLLFFESIVFFVINLCFFNIFVKVL